MVRHIISIIMLRSYLVGSFVDL